MRQSYMTYTKRAIFFLWNFKKIYSNNFF